MRLRFHRGTLLLEELAPHLPQLDVASLPGVLWDPRVQQYRAPARFGGALVAAIRERTGVLPEVVRRRGPAAAPWREVELRPHQQAALDAWQRVGRRGVVVLPTGSGKTWVALAAMARTGLRALCLVPTRVLLAQWVRVIGERYRGAVGRLGDGARQLEAVTVATFESARRRMPEIGDRFELLVVDEAHHVGGALRDEALEMCSAAARLGLTATPPTDGTVPGLRVTARPAPPGAVEERLAELVGPTVYEVGMGDLAGGVLAPFDAITLHLELDADEQREYHRCMGAFRTAHAELCLDRPGAGWQQFVAAAQRTAQGRAALASWRRAQQLLALPRAKREALATLLARHRESRVLVFTADNRTAYAVAREHLITPLTCDIGRAERTAALERFRAGRLRALVSARVLNEGVDVPAADVGIIVGAAQGQREHAQRVGRLLRPAPGKRAAVYELVLRRTTEERRAQRRRVCLAPRATITL